MVLVFYGYAFVLHIHRISMAGEEVYEFHTRIAEQEKHCQAYGKKYSTQLSEHNS
jgi:hypothetical protein